jgi:hypothetical protein
MDSDVLKERLEALGEQADEVIYQSFPKGEYGFPSSLTPQWQAWSQRVHNLITEHFKRDSAPVRLVEKGVEAQTAIIGNDKDEFKRAKSFLEGGISEALDAIEGDFFGEMKDVSATEPDSFDPEKIFVVHGHDHETKNEVELFLKEVGLDPVVLHRQPDEGNTIIEKFETHSSVGYAIVLLTPDDEVVLGRDDDGAVKETEKRARPNVVFELGYFVGKLGRERVCCVAHCDVSMPSDISGLIYKPFDESIDEVKYNLVKELQKANYNASL